MDGGEAASRHDDTSASVETMKSILMALRGVQIPYVIVSWTIRFLAIAFGVMVWHYLSSTQFNYIVSFENIPTPADVADAFGDQVLNPDFYVHIMVSMQRILIGYGFAIVTGIGIGVLMGRSKIIANFVIPYIEILRPIPAVAWIPLAILIWPTEESSIIFITYLGAFFPIVLNTVHGVEETPEVLVRAAKSLGAKRMAVFWHVVIPGALPSITTGLAIGMGVAWFSLLAGEIISGQYGIGYWTWESYQLIKYPQIIIGMLVIGFLGTGSTFIVKLATSPLLRWQKTRR